ncbi:MAG: Zn-dependent metalloprotease, partial [Alteromonadaceae bacterium]
MFVKFYHGLCIAGLALCSNLSHGAQSYDVSLKNLQLAEAPGQVKTAVSGFISARLNQQKLNSDYQLQLIKPKTAAQRYQQYYRGIAVWGQQIAVQQFPKIIQKQASKQILKQQTKWLSGRLASGIEIDLLNAGAVTPTIDREQAALQVHNKALADYGFDSKAEVSMVNVEQYIYITSANKAVLSWYVEALYQDAQGKTAKPVYFIDANNGATLIQWNNLQNALATGPGGNEKTAKYEFGEDYPSLQVSENDGRCQLSHDHVKTYDASNDLTAEPFEFDCYRNEYKAINGAYSPLNDAHYFASQTIDLYSLWYNAKVLPGHMPVMVHYGTEYPNAFWDGSAIVFGDGGSDIHPLGSLDIVAHEIAHAFTEKNSHLI